ncbi:MAG TPA: TRC40/GET3/ArsA family transport-energizing ATPase, partial [Acidimicrobiia bacterium]|nr:TRC40/GET3/ArsA family transport-energizing ATPase [Acidimicrobiia bacterium]
TDPAHSLADAYDVPLGDVPTEIAPRLWGQQLNARVRFEQAWDDVRAYMVDILDWAGADTVEAEELAVIPGLDEVFALADIKTFATSGDYDVIVVDCAPTAETIRLLSLPDILSWYMERVFETQRRLTRIARPLLDRVTNLPIAGENVFGAVRTFYDRLDGVRELLTAGDITSARLVVNPERMVVAEARRTFTYLSLFGYHVDAVIANRMLPDAIQDPWFARWKATQTAHLELITDAFAPLPVLAAELAGNELAGHDELSQFGGALYGSLDPTARLADLEPLRVEAVGDTLVLSLHLPFTHSNEVELGRTEQELFLSVGPHRRALMLPDSLSRREVAGARVAGDRLEVEFV